MPIIWNKMNKISLKTVYMNMNIYTHTYHDPLCLTNVGTENYWRIYTKSDYLWRLRLLMI